MGLGENKNAHLYYVDGTECTHAKIITLKKRNKKWDSCTQLSFQFCCVHLSGTETELSPSIGVDVSLIIVSGRVWSCTVICMVPIVWVRLCWAMVHWCGSLRPVIAGMINYTELNGIQIHRYTDILLYWHILLLIQYWQHYINFWFSLNGTAWFLCSFVILIWFYIRPLVYDIEL